MRQLFKILVLMAAFLAISNAFAETPLTVINAEVMLAPPGVSVTAGLMTVRNNSEQDIIIERIEAENFERVELHKTEVVDGMARMIAQENLVIPAGGELQLMHGGYHMMLYAPAHGFAEGDTVKMTLYSSAGQISFSAPVKRLSL